MLASVFATVKNLGPTQSLTDFTDHSLTQWFSGSVRAALTWNDKLEGEVVLASCQSPCEEKTDNQ